MRRWAGTFPEAASIGLMSAGVLGLELSFTRIAASVLQFQFTFVVITLSLAGLGVGALLATTGLNDDGARFSAAAAFGVVTLVVAQAIPFIVRVQGAHYWLMVVALVLPFILAGHYITATFQAKPERIGALYAADLGGAALACVAAVAAMNAIGPVATARLAGVVGSASALCCARGLLPRFSRRLAIGGLCAAVSPVVALPWLGAAEKIFSSRPSPTAQPLASEASDERGALVRTYWDAFARTDVVRHSNSRDRLEIFTNGNVPSTMYRVSAPLSVASGSTLARAALERAGLPGAAAVPFLIARPGRVLSVGPGGGLDLLLAVATGARHVAAVEVNPSIANVLRDYADFNGRILEHPSIEYTRDDARHFLENTDRRYDLIFAALTQSGVGNRSLVLPESHFSTREGFGAAWRHLTRHGRLALVFHNPAYAYRYLATATAALRADERFSDAEVLEHAVLMYGDADPYRVLLLLQKDPLSAVSASRIGSLARTLGLTVVHLPPTANGGLGRVLQGEMSLERYLSVLDASVGVRSSVIATDDRPYFLDLDLKIPGELVGLLVAGTMSLGAIVAVAPGSRGRRGTHRSRTRRILISAGCTGSGFVAFELFTIEASGLALGDPTRALVLTLVTLLVAGSGASLLVARGISRRWIGWERLWWLPAVVAVACLVVGMTGGLQATTGFGPPGTVVLVALTALLGLAAAGAFAAVLCTVGRDVPKIVPWLWAANSIGTIVGGAVAVGAPRLVGIGWSWHVVGGLYGLAALSLTACPSVVRPSRIRGLIVGNSV